MKFTDKLKELRESHGFTQRQVAAALNIDVALYNRFEKGERHVKRDLLGKVADLYSCPLEELTKYWLAGQIYTLLYDEESAQDVIGMVAEEIPIYNSTRKHLH